MTKMNLMTIIGKFEVDLKVLLCLNCKDAFGFSNDNSSFIKLCLKCYEAEREKEVEFKRLKELTD